MILGSRSASAQASNQYLAEQLKTNDDYRVRTQAALALGATGTDEAVGLLCEALSSDSHVSVRVASAAALSKLGKPGALPCLTAAEPKEAAPAVRSQIQKAIGSLQTSSKGVPMLRAEAKYYIAIDIANKSQRANADVDLVVRSAMQDKLTARPAFAIIPSNEPPLKTSEVLKAKKMKGFFLLATVEPPLYESGNLTQVVRVSVWSYPGKALRGEFSPKLTQSNTSSGDIQSENALLRMCAESAVENFQTAAPSM